MIKVSPLGELELIFSEDVFKLSEPVDFSELFKFQIISSLDGTISLGYYSGYRYNDTDKELYEKYDTDNSIEDYFNFNWTVKEYNSANLTFKFDFEKPETIS
jgi:hypothetical protein